MAPVFVSIIMNKFDEHLYLNARNESDSPTFHSILYTMRLATVISLLLFACAACALQLHHQERRNGFRSSVIPRRRLGSSIGPDIVPRGNQMPKHPCSPNRLLSDLKQTKETNRYYMKEVNGIRIYRLNHPIAFDQKEFVVKEIVLAVAHWSEDDMKKEVRSLSIADELFAALFDGTKYFILMRGLGKKYDLAHCPVGPSAFTHMEQTEKRLEETHDIKRVLNHGRALSWYDYTWNLLPNGTWKLGPVGSWRYGVSDKHPQRGKHYCGIKEWDEHGLPVFLRLDSTTTG